MATRVYECELGLEYEIEQKITESRLEVCKVCGKCRPKPLIGSTSFILLGGSWAKDGYS